MERKAIPRTLVALLISVFSCSSLFGQEFPFRSTVELRGIGVDLVCHTSTQRAYVSVPVRDEVVVLSTRRLHAVERIPVGESPYGLAVSEDGNTLFVALQAPDRSDGTGGRGTLAVLDLRDGSREDILLPEDRLGFTRPAIARIAPGRVVVNGYPGEFLAVVDIDPEGNHAIQILDQSLPEVTFVRTNDGRSLFAGSRSPDDPARIWKADLQAAGLEFAPVPLPTPVSSAAHLEPSPDGGRLYLDSGEVIDTTTGNRVAWIAPGAHAFGDRDDSVFVARDSGKLEEFKTATHTKFRELTFDCTIRSVTDLVALPADRGFVVLSDDLACVVAQPPECDAPTVLPRSPSPADQETFVPTDPVLTWTSMPLECHERFEVFVDTVDPPVTRVCEDLAVPRCRLDGLDPGVRYFWRVVTSTSGGQIEGPVWSFTTQPCIWDPVDVSVELPGRANDMVFQPARRELYVSIPGLRQVLIYSFPDFELVGTIELAAGARQMKLSVDGRRLFVGITRPQQIAIIDLESRALTPIDLTDVANGDGLRSLAEFPPNRLYATFATRSRDPAALAVVRLNEDNAVERVELPGTPACSRYLAGDPDGWFLYHWVACGRELRVYATARPALSQVATWSVSESTIPPLFSPDGGRIYFADGRVFRTGSHVQERSVPAGEKAFGNHPDRLFVVRDGELVTVDTAKSSVLGRPLELRCVTSDTERLVILPDGAGFLALGTGLSICGTIRSPRRSEEPDRCEPDCNENSRRDDVDIEGPRNFDCNTNGIPDECDVASGTSADVNEDGAPDECDLNADSVFVRGDLDQDGRLTVLDGILVARGLFEDDAAVSRCWDAADANDSGNVDLTDLVFGLNHLLLRGPALPAPYLACGVDPTDDPLDCLSYERCSVPLSAMEFFGEVFSLNGVFWVLDRSPPHHDNPRWKTEVGRSLGTLRPGTRFGITYFDADILGFPTSEVPATASPESIASAEAWLASVRSGRGTCPHGGLLRALRQANASSVSRPAIFFVSDGGGTCRGNNEIDYLQQTLEEVSQNNVRNIPIHVFAAPFSPQANEEFLRQLAEQSGGTYRSLPR